MIDANRVKNHDRDPNQNPLHLPFPISNLVSNQVRRVPNLERIRLSLLQLRPINLLHQHFLLEPRKKTLLQDSNLAPLSEHPKKLRNWAGSSLALRWNHPRKRRRNLADLNLAPQWNQQRLPKHLVSNLALRWSRLRRRKKPLVTRKQKNQLCRKLSPSP